MAIKAKKVNNFLRWYEDTTDETVRVDAPLWQAFDFNEDTLSTDFWALADNTTGGVDSTGSISVALGGIVRLTTGDEDDDDIQMASEIIYNTGKRCAAEARIRINDVSGCALFFGLTDAKSEAANLIAITLSTATTAISTATDAVGVVWDPDGSTSNLYFCSVNTSGDATKVTYTPSTAFTDAAWHTYRVEVDGNNTPTYYADGSYVGTGSTAVCSTGADLCVYVGVINREATGNTVDIDYIKTWQAR